MIVIEKGKESQGEAMREQDAPAYTIPPQIHVDAQGRTHYFYPRTGHYPNPEDVPQHNPYHAATGWQGARYHVQPAPFWGVAKAKRENHDRLFGLSK